MESFVQNYIDDNLKLLAALDAKAIAAVIAEFGKARDDDKRIYAIGNGGSASTASHFVVDMGKGASIGRAKRFKTIPLTDNMEWITALSNDISYDDVFVEQLKNFAEPGDVLLAISGSGNSENVLRAVKHANDVGCVTVGFTGFEGGKLNALVDHGIVVPSEHMGRIEDIHVILQHMICYYYMENQ
ncbi:MAG: SIS domain-containing protein [Candidatus Latescibacteria bacterium]|jgi:D-sedoheptulose 7-phosphate isomerase|nr:SIS domain-containing protein [Candidatus Latescibacterota bacterium]MBT5830901.1 SIS domain-containing protein [Candidatus Latescibacterota bacterium]